MIVRRPLAALSSLERQVFRAQRLQSGQCVRCFHASVRQAAQDGTSGQDGAQIHEPAPYNAPKRGPSRQERAAMISNEVSMLQRGPPLRDGDPTVGPGSVTGTYQRDPEPPTTSAGFAETPQSMGGERMGENVSAGREGITAQGVGRFTGADDNARDEATSGRRTRKASKVSEPVEGRPDRSVHVSSLPFEVTEHQLEDHMRIKGTLDVLSIQIARRSNGKSEGRGIVEYATRKQAQTALQRFNNTTLMGRRIAVHVQQPQVVEDSISSAEASSLRDKIALINASGRSIEPHAPNRSELLYQGAGGTTPASHNPEAIVLDQFRLARSPTESVEVKRAGKTRRYQELADTLITGTYQKSWLSAEEGHYKDKTLNMVMKKLAMNGTYLESDAWKLIQKALPLLPAPMRAKTPAGQAREDAAVKRDAKKEARRQAKKKARAKVEA